MAQANNLLHKQQTYKIHGAIFEVHNILGSGFLESVYHEALKKEFDLQHIPYKSELEIDVVYKKVKLETKFRADFLCYGTILLELKACTRIEDIHKAQLLNYMKASSIPIGLLINFNSSPDVEIQRFAL